MHPSSDSQTRWKHISVSRLTFHGFLCENRLSCIWHPDSDLTIITSPAEAQSPLMDADGAFDALRVAVKLFSAWTCSQASLYLLKWPVLRFLCLFSGNAISSWSFGSNHLFETHNASAPPYVLPHAEKLSVLQLTTAATVTVWMYIQSPFICQHAIIQINTSQPHRTL